MTALTKLAHFWTHCVTRTAPTRDKIRHQFIDHPEATGETYLQHLAFTIVMAGRLVLVGFVLLAHGIFPFLFTRTGSHQLDRIWRIMTRRKMQVKTPIEVNEGDAI